MFQTSNQASSSTSQEDRDTSRNINYTAGNDNSNQNDDDCDSNDNGDEGSDNRERENFFHCRRDHDDSDENNSDGNRDVNEDNFADDINCNDSNHNDTDDVDNDDSSDDRSDTNDQNNDQETISHAPFLTIDESVSDDILIPKHGISIKDHLLSAIAMSVRHNLTYEATIDQLKWMKSIYFNNSIPTNKAQLWKSLSRNDNCLTRHYYCKICRDYLGEKCKQRNKLEKQCSCKACGPDDELESNLCYFIYISLTAQMQELLSMPNIAESLKYRFQRTKKDVNSYEDIYDGEQYKSLSSPGNFLHKWYNFSLTINTDGCQTSKSSNTSAWPVYAMINELPPNLRKKNMLLAAIYVDSEHPQMNNFLRPFTTEVQQFFSSGITWKPTATSKVTSRFIVTTCSLDAPARASVVRMKQFNGKNGCLWCYADGKSLGPGKFVYPLSQYYKKQRTGPEIRADMLYAFETGKIKNGVKNISSLVALPLFNICKGVVVEAMHAVYLGVIKRHTQILMTTATVALKVGRIKRRVKSPYYVGDCKSKNLIEKRLLSIKPPSCRSRKPRSISTYQKWKASEWRNWLDYAPICLQQVLPSKYINHLLLLSEAIHYLNSDSITSNDLDRCEKMIKKYVQLYQKYFGVENMTSNLHSLTHLVQVVRNWGPIWAHEASTFESWNRKIMEKVTSSFAQTDQIATRFLMNKFITTSMSDNTVSVETKKYISKLINVPIGDRANTKNKIVTVGKQVTHPPSDQELIELMKASYQPINLKYFKKMKINGIRYMCKTKKNFKFCDSTICDHNGEFGIIVAIVEFENGGEIIRGIFVKQMRRICYAFNSKFINKVSLSNDLVFIKESPFIRPAIQLYTGKNYYVIKQTNCWETD